MEQAVEEHRSVGLGEIDWVRVGAAMREVRGNLSDDAMEEVSGFVVSVAETYLEKDLDGAEELRVEYMLSRDVNGWHEHGMVDLAIRRGERWHLYDWKRFGSKSFEPRDGQRLELDPAWVFYSTYWPGAVSWPGIISGFTYRNVAVQMGKIIEVSLKLSPEVVTRFKEKLQWMKRNVNWILPYPVWPQNGDACFAFGRECEHVATCGTETFPIIKRISPSVLKTFMLCPQRARYALDARREIGDTGEPAAIANDAAQWGTVFHAGIGDVYRQAWERRTK